MISREEIYQLISEHHNYVRSYINLIGSENVSSPIVKLALASDLIQRYTTHGSYSAYDRLESKVQESFSNLLNAEFANVKPISGTIANLIAFLTLTRRNDTIMAASLSCGGHKNYMDFGLAGILGLKHTSMPFDEKEWIVDVDSLNSQIEKVHPGLIVIGGMTFLFPQPVQEIVDLANEHGAKVLYDGAQVFGLILGGNFQNPINEGVDLMTASTHKTFPGPQGGIILGRSDYSTKTKELIRAIMANEHPFRIPSLAFALLEMISFGKDYTVHIVENARALGQALYERGFKVLCEHKSFTRTHQVVVDISNIGDSGEVTALLEKTGIICKQVMIPKDDPSKTKVAIYPPKKVSGLRLGVAEVTRLGMKKLDMIEIANIMEQALFKKENPDKLRKTSEQFKERFNKICFTFEPGTDAYEHYIKLSNRVV